MPTRTRSSLPSIPQVSRPPFYQNLFFRPSTKRNDWRVLCVCCVDVPTVLETPRKENKGNVYVWFSLLHDGGVERREVYPPRRPRARLRCNVQRFETRIKDSSTLSIQQSKKKRKKMAKRPSDYISSIDFPGSSSVMSSRGSQVVEVPKENAVLAPRREITTCQTGHPPRCCWTMNSCRSRGTRRSDPAGRERQLWAPAVSVGRRRADS